MSTQTPRRVRPAPGAPTATPAKPKVSLRSVWPLVWSLLRPRRWMLALGMVLMAINRVCGLVLPGSSKFLIDDVLGMRGTPSTPGHVSVAAPQDLLDRAWAPLRHVAHVTGIPAPGPHPELLVPLVGVVVLATLVQGGTSFALTQLLSKEAQRLIAEMRRRVQTHVSKLPVGYYDANKTGALVSRIMNDVEGVRNLIGTGLVEFVGGLLTAALSLFVLLQLNFVMTALTAAVLVSFTLVLNRAFAVMRPIFRERGRITAEVTGRLTESLGAVRTVKGYHAEQREQGVFAGGVQKLLDNVLATLTAQSVMQLSSSLLLGFVGALIMFVGTRHILGGTLTLGGYFSYTMFLGFLIAPVFQVVAIGTQLTEAMAGLERTREVLAELPEDTDPRRVARLERLRGAVAFEHVDFAYEADKPVLQDVSFSAEPGTVVALVGSSGSGKSTIIGLLAAFHVPQAGRVVVDGVDLSTVRLETFRTQLGVVLQDTFLFAGTIRENVAFSRPDATDDEIAEACRIARVDEFANRFPEGLDTIVGERGIKLSGGQRQRVSISRAILADPRLLILDEATSSLDSESEALIQEGLSALMRNRTTFVIAHRLSTIRRADQILVVEEGRIIERGNHAQLYALGGRYRDLYDRQHGLEQNLFLAPGEGDSVPDAEGRAARGAAVPGMLDLMQGRGR
ncbi:MAG TPA: ABC transporter ATP-binding protein [Candidatus Acidoferrales bacterium]|nr:ABC transporter ATP-binding protein [Candidatus Acidoferrales bacterium]